MEELNQAVIRIAKLPGPFWIEAISGPHPDTGRFVATGRAKADPDHIERAIASPPQEGAAADSRVRRYPPNEGEAAFGRWQPCPVNATETDTFRMRVHGGWIVRAFDALHRVEASGDVKRGRSTMIFVPDPPSP